jgi:hypothetical protein
MINPVVSVNHISNAAVSIHTKMGSSNFIQCWRVISKIFSSFFKTVLMFVNTIYLQATSLFSGERGHAVSCSVILPVPGVEVSRLTPPEFVSNLFFLKISNDFWKE